MIRSVRLLLFLSGLTGLCTCAGPSTRIAPIPRDRRVDEVLAIRTRIKLKETYVFNVGATLYVLPYGPYLPEGQDDKGIYYRAPIPIVTRGWLGSEALVQGGIYVPTELTWTVGLVWLYVRQDGGSIDMELMPSGFSLTYGDRWFREAMDGAP